MDGNESDHIVAGGGPSVHLLVQLTLSVLEDATARDVLAVWLIGSRAYGEHTEASDWDFWACVSNDVVVKQRQPKHHQVDVSVYTKDELQALLDAHEFLALHCHFAPPSLRLVGGDPGLCFALDASALKEVMAREQNMLANKSRKMWRLGKHRKADKVLRHALRYFAWARSLLLTHALDVTTAHTDAVADGFVPRAECLPVMCPDTRSWDKAALHLRAAMDACVVALREVINPLVEPLLADASSSPAAPASSLRAAWGERVQRREALLRPWIETRDRLQRLFTCVGVMCQPLPLCKGWLFLHAKQVPEGEDKACSAIQSVCNGCIIGDPNVKRVHNGEVPTFGAVQPPPHVATCNTNSGALASNLAWGQSMRVVPLLAGPCFASLFMPEPAQRWVVVPVNWGQPTWSPGLIRCWDVVSEFLMAEVLPRSWQQVQQRDTVVVWSLGAQEACMQPSVCRLSDLSGEVCFVWMEQGGQRVEPAAWRAMEQLAPPELAGCEGTWPSAPFVLADHCGLDPRRHRGVLMVDARGQPLVCPLRAWVSARSLGSARDTSDRVLEITLVTLACCWPDITCDQVEAWAPGAGVVWSTLCPRWQQWHRHLQALVDTARALVTTANGASPPLASAIRKVVAGWLQGQGPAMRPYGRIVITLVCDPHRFPSLRHYFVWVTSEKNIISVWDAYWKQGST